MPAGPNRTSNDLNEDRSSLTRYLRVIAEAILLLLIVAAPWAFGGVDPEWQFAISLGVIALVACWLARCVIYRRMSFRADWVSFGLSGLACLSAIQLIPLPVAIVSILSPNRAGNHRSLIPETLERIGGEAEMARSSFISLSSDPSLTRHFLADICMVLSVYVVARNWLATRNSVRRLAWVMAINGLAIACFAFGQFFLSNDKMYGVFPIATAFGPFICRNHYPFFAYMTLGVIIGLALYYAKSEYASSGEKGIKGQIQTMTRWFSHATQSPSNVILLAAAMIVAISIPFSLSRGGMVTLIVCSVFLSWLMKTGAKDGSFAAPIIIAAMALGLGGWLGWGPIERRLGGTVDGLVSSDSRSSLWKSAIKIAIAYPVFGVGNNAFQRVEPMERPVSQDLGINLINDSVHNEYLEAMVEGGPIRFLLTIAIAFGAVVSAVRAYRRLGTRSNGSIALGFAFGLLGIAVHSFFDFGIHIPAIALLAAVAAAYSEACASDSEFVPTKRNKSSGSEQVSSTDINSSTSKPHRSQAITLTGPPAWAMAAVVGLSLILIVRQYRIWDVAERYRSAAIATAKPEVNDPNLRIALCEAATLASPDDPELYLALARAHFDAAILIQSKLEPVDNSTYWTPKLSDDVVRKHVVPGLKAAKLGRAICPTLAPAHMRFALYRDYCESADSAVVYLERAIRLAPCDPEAYYAAGLEALSRKDLKSAAEHWRQSLKLNGRQLDRILVVAKKGGMSPIEIRDQLLPDEPSVLLAAAEKLYPDHKEMIAERKPFLERIRRLGDQDLKPTSRTLETLAQVQHEMGDPSGAQIAWRRAVDLSPNDLMLRERYAKWLESEDLIEPLVSELEWLKNKGSGSKISDRLELARRLNDLKQNIDKN